MELINESVEVLASIIDCIVIIYFLNSFLDLKESGYSRFYISLSGIVPLFIIAHYLSEYFLIQAILQIILTFAYEVVFLQGNNIKKIMTDFILVVVMSTGNMITIQTVSFVTGIETYRLVEAGSNQRIIVLVLTKLIMIFLAYLILDIFQTDMKLKKDEFILISIYFFASSIISIILLNIIVNVQMNPIEQIQMISVTGFLFAITIISFVLLHKIEREREYETINKILRTQLEEQKTAMIKNQMMYEETRKLKHDINRHLTIMLDMLKSNAVDEVITEMERIVNLKSYQTVIYVESNRMINAVLNEKANICKDNQIQLDLHIMAVIEKEKELETAILLSNILDNAIEAQQNLKNERKILLEIFRHNGTYNIILTNRIEQSVLKTNPLLHTTKKEQKEHGVGLLSVKDTVKKFHGNFNCTEEEDSFSVHIMIPQEA